MQGAGAARRRLRGETGMSFPKRAGLFLAFATFDVTIATSAASGQVTEALITPTMAVESGLALARSQIGESDLLGALATLERVLFNHPSSGASRLLYASVLCRLDDRRGAELEVELLKDEPIEPTAWLEVTAACGDLPRPSPLSGAEVRR
jgi:hypothetical protein